MDSASDVPQMVRILGYTGSPLETLIGVDATFVQTLALLRSATWCSHRSGRIQFAGSILRYPLVATFDPDTPFEQRRSSRRNCRSRRCQTMASDSEEPECCFPDRNPDPQSSPVFRASLGQPDQLPHECVRRCISDSAKHASSTLSTPTLSWFPSTVQTVHRIGGFECGTHP